ncbi:DNA recombination protein RmuC [Rhodanobacter sp. DHB23]|uniref:DNA recombination protein RmuC n=1 Tax=Rhodanobacter sp. DHB23 TaxID=2775923 RepID=UPI001784482E|nr:DNA recombination protein RmuC [Rhodanobacter sp. DHB23]MBD8874094.1 DNA recombination protein RmuC [Rhodanobacter sp. DHB23]
MPSSETLLILLVVLALLLLALQVALLLRGRGDAGVAGKLDALKDDNERLQRSLRDEQRSGREELQQGFERFRGHVNEQLDGMSRQQAERIDGFGQRLAALTDGTSAGLQSLAQRLAEDARKSREELAQALDRFGEQQQQRLTALGAQHEQRMGEVRGTLEGQLKTLREDNAAQLEKMRATVDEKLQSTLETRLGQSFKLVSERLEAVQRGLGEMQSLATGVGDLKRVLGNVKTRGILGEVQLGALLEQLLITDQYEANVATVPGSNDRVEYAIRLPGADREHPVWLPVDAKFPREDYERLLDAQERADADAANLAATALERRVREEARTIRAKYVAPPHTTDFAILFLPTEGLYAEVLRRPGLFESLQHEHRVTVAGPTTLSALLNSLQMGFRTLAIQQRSSEVWQLLGAVKSEFGKFANILEKAERQLNTVSKSIGDAGKKTRTIERRLRGVESLSADDATRLLGDAAVDDDADNGTDEDA